MLDTHNVDSDDRDRSCLPDAMMMPVDSRVLSVKGTASKGDRVLMTASGCRRHMAATVARGCCRCERIRRCTSPS